MSAPSPSPAPPASVKFQARLVSQTLIKDVLTTYATQMSHTIEGAGKTYAQIVEIAIQVWGSNPVYPNFRADVRQVRINYTPGEAEGTIELLVPAILIKPQAKMIVVPIVG